MIYFLILLTVGVNAIHNKYRNINYNSFTIVHVNHSIDNIINYSYNDIDNNKVDIDHHINMYSLFTQSYFNNCQNYDVDDKYCKYNLHSQELACHHAVESEGGQLYYHGVYTDEYMNMEILGDGAQRTGRKINRIYEIKGMYIIQDLTEDEKTNKHKYCKNNDFIKTFKYTREPTNFYRRMIIYILVNDDQVHICPIWLLQDH
jgi:hypothetical protein